MIGMGRYRMAAILSRTITFGAKCPSEPWLLCWMLVIKASDESP